MKQGKLKFISEQKNGIPHFLKQYEKQWMQLNPVNANKFHTPNGDKIHSL
jgi:hypothetical protein